MPRDEIAVCILVVALAAWVTIHFLVATRLARSRPWWRAPVAFIVPPLAPYWAYKTGHRALAVAWGVAVVLWGTCRVFFAA